jgi:hypothetical protein
VTAPPRHRVDVRSCPFGEAAPDVPPSGNLRRSCASGATANEQAPRLQALVGRHGAAREVGSILRRLMPHALPRGVEAAVDSGIVAISWRRVRVSHEGREAGE